MTCWVFGIDGGSRTLVEKIEALGDPTVCMCALPFRLSISFRISFQILSFQSFQNVRYFHFPHFNLHYLGCPEDLPDL
jgi:hypothetical protein